MRNLTQGAGLFRLVACCCSLREKVRKRVSNCNQIIKLENIHIDGFLSARVAVLHEDDHPHDPDAT